MENAAIRFYFESRHYQNRGKNRLHAARVKYGPLRFAEVTIGMHVKPMKSLKYTANGAEICINRIQTTFGETGSIFASLFKIFLPTFDARRIN